MLAVLMSGPSEPPEKTKLRAEMRARLRAMPPDAVEHASTAIVAQLQREPQWCAGARVVAFFGGLRGEPDLRSLLPWLHRQGITTALFAIERDHLVPLIVSEPGDFEEGPYGVWVPRTAVCAPLAVPEVSVVLAPGLAFCMADGARLGRGAGFYDRFFAHPEASARRVGVCFESQLLDHLPAEPHDAPMHAIVTESRFVRVPS